MTGRNTINPGEPRYSYISRNLPHKFSPDRAVFITYRVKFTLPAIVVTELNQRKTEWYQKLQTIAESEKAEYLRTKDARVFLWFDELISKADGVPKTLQRKDITDIIADSFRHFDGLRYHLLAYCIMPNHVHVLIDPAIHEDGDIYPISHVTYTWKRFTATAINRVLTKSGSFWQQESYDHLIRDADEFDRVLGYLIDNPVKAGLVNDWTEWSGTWVRADLSR
ncbi:MAG TPA: hypothetical protein P5533_01145 [Candidatus Cloacimonadota bacterium]|nr:hypothetical protein [Candidatus Cloacimonadota bacterium]